MILYLLKFLLIVLFSNFEYTFDRNLKNITKWKNYYLFYKKLIIVIYLYIGFI